MLTIPFGNKNNSLKDSIIIILCSSWPLTVKQIHSYLYKNFNINISYQAVHKSISELKTVGILTETENGWQLSFEWINNSYNFFHKLKDSHKNNPFFNSLISPEEITSINFKNLTELDDFYFNLFEHIIPKSKSKNMIFCLKHDWRPILYPKKEYEILKTDHNFHFLISGCTDLDKWCIDFLKKLGANVCDKTNYSSICDAYIIDHLIIQVHIPKNLMEKIELLFSTHKDINNIDINQLMEDLFKKNYKITIIINKNEELARQIRHQILNY